MNCISTSVCTSCVESTIAARESSTCNCPRGFYSDGENDECLGKYKIIFLINNNNN